MYRLLLIPFFGLLGVLLYAEYIDNIKLRYLCMVTLMPLLIIYYILGALSQLSVLILLGTVFGYIGDILLMFHKDNLFIFGLGSFLVGHVFYIIGFLISIENLLSFPIWGFLFVIPSVIAIVVFLKRTENKMGDLKVPTLVYVGVIFSMAFFSMLRLASFGGLAFFFPWFGAQLFMVSDGMIAVKKFDKDFKNAEVYIKLTYILAQYFIAQGIMLSIL